MNAPDDPSTDLALAADIAGAGDWPDLLPLDAATIIERVMTATLRHAGLSGRFEVSLVLTGDEQMRRANKRFRGIDRPTDVLSFPLADAPLIPLAPGARWVSRLFGDDTHGAPDGAAPPDPVPPPVAAPAFDGGSPRHLGDMMIAVPTVARQAMAAGHSAWYELCFLVAHGMLHLVGYDDYFEQGYQAMVAIQEAVLVELHIAREA